MIDIIKQTPVEYSKQSRDYQLLARLYTILYNSSKAYADNLFVWGGHVDKKLSLLRAKTLNFNPRFEWDPDELAAATSCFKYLVARKGAKIAIEYCVAMLMRINNLEGTCTFDDGGLVFEDNELLIKIPEQLASIGIINDLFDNILPAGITFRVEEYIRQDIENATHVYLTQDVSSELVESSELTIGRMFGLNAVTDTI